ncbi:penicillin-binding protein activator [Lysobacter niastensis]|uniref:Penicillin-binding protein activator n=2 Tax=Lysobacter niastensis TaxID=380629 RepID=A0ABS0BG34_9GAMM|nr:penicillin-binding protein activator [Lysobacter niastensis]
MIEQMKHASARARSMHRGALKGMIAALVLAATLNGCSTVAPKAGGAVTAGHPLVVQAAQLARSGATLTGPARQANDAEIDRLLSQLDDASLSREAAALPVGEPLYNYAGRALLRRGLALPRAFDRTGWKFGQRPAAESDGYRPPVRMAVLLPLSGDLAVASSPVRDGLLAGYYGEQRRRPEVVFYDTFGTAGGTLAAYDRAVAEGSDFVVGPLGRDEVGALYGKGALPVPVLALNRTNNEPPIGNASFSLSPEDEGFAAAEYLLNLKAKRVLVVGGADETQRRAVAALRDRLAVGGAAVTDVASEGTSDFAPYASKEGGVDAVFLAVRGTSARTLMPRLALAGLAGKPRVATSQLLSGTGSKATEDAILDGIAFPTEAWATRGARGLPSPASAGTMLATAKGPGARLFAFGFDAWQISAYLEYLATANNAHIEGATGTLRLDGFGNVLRTPAWSTFRSGVTVPLPQGDKR